MGTRRDKHSGSKPSKRRDGRWQVRTMVTDPETGATRRVSIYGRTEREVKGKAAAFRKEVEKRIDTKQAPIDARVGLGAYATTWISTTLAASDRKASTKAGYSILARRHIVGREIGQVTLDKLRPSTIESWVGELKSAGYSESTVRQTYTVARLVLETAVRDGLLGVNPAASVKRPRVERREAEYLTPAQVHGLLEAAKDVRYGMFFELLVRTGLRRGEALALRWRDVNLERKQATVRGSLSSIGGDLSVSSPKTRASRRTIDLSDRAVEVLRKVKQRQRQERILAGSKWQGDGELVFTTDLGRPVDPRNTLRDLKRATRLAGIKGLEGEVGLHTLRHTAAATMLLAGVPMLVVSRHLGHTSIATTVDLYGHVAPESSRAAVEALDQALAH